MKKNIGAVTALYPMPMAVVGTMIDGKPNWLLAGHFGIVAHDRILVSLHKAHYSNRGIKANRALSLNLVDEALLPAADHVGCVSGAKADKSEVFAWTPGGNGAPLVDASPLSMVCEVVDIYETESFENFICKISAVHAEESVLDEHGKIDYGKLRPVLFEMPTYSYLRTGDVIAKCRSFETARRGNGGAPSCR